MRVSVKGEKKPFDLPPRWWKNNLIIAELSSIAMWRLKGKFWNCVFVCSLLCLIGFAHSLHSVCVFVCVCMYASPCWCALVFVSSDVTQPTFPFLPVRVCLCVHSCFYSLREKPFHVSSRWLGTDVTVLLCVSLCVCHFLSVFCLLCVMQKNYIVQVGHLAQCTVCVFVWVPRWVHRPVLTRWLNRPHVLWTSVNITMSLSFLSFTLFSFLCHSQNQHPYLQLLV